MVAFLVVVGIVVRAGAAQWIPWDHLPDARNYESYARNLATGGGYRDDEGRFARRPPVYPVVLSFVYMLAGTKPEVARGIQIVLSAAVGVGILYMGTRLLGARPAWFGFFLWEFYPPAVYFSLVLVSETLFVGLLVALLAVGVWSLQRTWAKAGVAVGGVWGLLVHTRPIAIFVASVLAPLWWRSGWGARKIALALTAGTVVLVLGTASWGVRNQTRLGAFVPFTTHGGYDLWVSHHPVADGRGVYPELSPFVVEADRKLSGELERDRFFVEAFWANLKDDPWQSVRLVPMKLWWLLKPWAETGGWMKAVGIFSDSVILPLAVAGAFVARRQPGGRVLLWTTVYVLAVHAVIGYGSFRFRFTAAPAYLLLAAVPLASVYERVAARRGRSGPTEN
ncbi:MAG: hypothetical protein A2V83_00685 [Nitrospirae bacterium RBG_16_64_22]|nr:MAG: hypothetical protein A2V83_00685 [Nitrospirae bacterium RBG_16_64_22]